MWPRGEAKSCVRFVGGVVVSRSCWECSLSRGFLWVCELYRVCQRLLGVRGSAFFGVRVR